MMNQNALRDSANFNSQNQYFSPPMIPEFNPLRFGPGQIEKINLNF